MTHFIFHPSRFAATCGSLMTLWIGLSFSALAADSPRKTVSLDQGWRFHLGDVTDAIAPGYDDHEWRRVDVPHDYVVEGTFDRTNPFVYPGMDTSWYPLHGFLPVQPAVYRKTISIPADAKGQRLWLEFDGVFSNSRYWLNGQDIGSQYSGYTRSRFDITDAADYGGRNILVVRVDPRYDGWWYEGGGIYRHVRLVMLDPVHIAPDGVFVALAVADPGDGIQADATVTVTTDVTNAGGAAVTATVLSEILDTNGRQVAAESTVQTHAAGAGSKATQHIPLARASLWSLENPYLYQLRSTISVSGKVVDRLTTNFGVRHIRFDADHGFFLNGKHVKIQGVNMHQDHAGVGVAMPDRLFEWRLERLKEMGCNAIRLSHNPVAPVLLDDCDRMGFLVIAENRHLGDTYADQTPKNTPAVEHRDLTALVMRDRNHPSIILWSLCNEQWIQGSPEAAAMARAMKQRVHELDPTRQVTAAMNGGFTNPEGFLSVLDVIGINYHPEVYETVHAQCSTNPIVASEIASEVGTRGFYGTNHWDNYWGDRERGYVSVYSINAGPGGQTVGNAWPPVATNEFMAGGFVWSGFDYKGEPRPFEWPVINSHYGFMDICGFPKDSYYYYKAWWTDKPVLHLFPHWNWPGREGQEISVWVHSNCQEVELFLNDVSQGRQTVTPYHHLEWKVNHAPGRLVAKGMHNGRPIEAVVETTGAPAAIRLILDRSVLGADNADLAVVNVAVLDAQGRVVPVADNTITFTMTGPGKIIGVGNGDPSSHEPDKASSRSAFNGLAQVIVQSTSKPGPITLTATSPGLESTQVSLTTAANLPLPPASTDVNAVGDNIHSPEATAHGPIPYATLQVIADGDSDAVIAEKAAKVLPRPNQSDWMRLEWIFFLHYGVNTFRGVEWGSGREDPSEFNPSLFDADQWVRAMKEAGGKMIVLVCKHHDGLCLWPTRYTQHSVASSPWLDGKGDVVRAVADAARKYGLKLGVYLSPADLYQLKTNPKNPAGYYGDGSSDVPSTIPIDPAGFKTNPTAGRTPSEGFGSYTYAVNDYNRYFLNQLYELLTEYGPIAEVWFDGANPDPSVKETYNYAAWYDLIHHLQPGAVIFGKGPDVRWVGSESGYGRTTEWSVIPLPTSPDNFIWPDMTAGDLGSRAKLTPGSYLWWYPTETNVTILRDGQWFWAPNKRPRSVSQLVDIYYSSIGRNGNLILNLSPDTRGLIPDDQLEALSLMARVVKDTFATDLAVGGKLTAGTSNPANSASLALDGNLDTWWEAAPGHANAALTLTLQAAVTFDVVSLQEALDHRGQRIESFAIETWNGSAWVTAEHVASDELTTVGHKRLIRLKSPVTTSQVRIRITGSRLEPTLAEMGLFKQPVGFLPPVISDRDANGKVTISNAGGLKMVYTVDGTMPTTHSTVYSSPISLPLGGTVQAACLLPHGQLGIEASKSFAGMMPIGWKVVGVDSQETHQAANAAIYSSYTVGGLLGKL